MDGDADGVSDGGTGHVVGLVAETRRWKEMRWYEESPRVIRATAFAVFGIFLLMLIVLGHQFRGELQTAQTLEADWLSIQQTQAAQLAEVVRAVATQTKQVRQATSALTERQDAVVAMVQRFLEADPERAARARWLQRLEALE